MLKSISAYFSPQRNQKSAARTTTTQRQPQEPFPTVPPHRLVIVGDACGGKTTLLKQLRLGRVDPSTIVSSTGFNVEQVTVLGVEFTVWDVAGTWSTRSLWHQFAKGAKAIICVVDSADETHIEETKEWLWRMYMDYDPDRESVLLVFANKQDRLGALSVSEVKDKLEMETRTQGRRWHIQGSIATTGDGLMDGMVWITSQLKDVSRT